MNTVNAPEPANRWQPTLVIRPNQSIGYLKCTMRAVLMMRHWTELWYSILCVKEAWNTRTGTGQFHYPAYAEAWTKYMHLRLLENSKRCPNVPRAYWIVRDQPELEIAEDRRPPRRSEPLGACYDIPTPLATPRDETSPMETSEDREHPTTEASSSGTEPMETQ